MENRGSENDKVSRGMWQAVETSAGEIRMEEAEGRRSEERGWKEERKKMRRRNRKKGK